MNSNPRYQCKNVTSLEDEIALLQDFWPGREDTYLKNEKTVPKPVIREVFIQHLGGRNRLGIFPLVEAKCRWAMVDVDNKDDLEGAKELAVSIQKRAAHYGLSLYLEQSRSKGYHLWLFISSWLEAWKARAVLKLFLDDLGITAEIFPKQDDERLTKKRVGNGGFLPWFNLLDRSPNNKFLDVSNGLGPYQDQIAFLRGAQKIDPAMIEDIIEINGLHRQDTRSSQDRDTPENRLARLLLPWWKDSKRDLLTMYLSGFLAKRGWDKERAIYVITKLADATCDEQKPSRLQVVENTFTNYENGEPVKGYQGLREEKLIDEQTLSELIKIMTEDTPWLVFSDKGKVSFLPGILAEHLAQHERSININGSLYLYKNGVYRRISDEEAREIISKHIPGKYRKTAWVSDTWNQWKAETFTDPKRLNPYGYINLKNRLYDWLDKEFVPHTPDLLFSIQLNAEYDHGAKCPRFLEALQEILEKETIPLIQEIFGYCLVPLTEYQKAFVFLGPGSNGKSTLLSVLQELLGRENVSNIPLQNLEERFMPAKLFNKLVNIYSDLAQTAMKSTSTFKIITGNDRLTAEEKYREPFEFQCSARLLFSCNQLPKSSDRSHAYYRRFIIVPFNRKFEGDKADPFLRDELIKELDGILIWSLEGLHRLIDQGRFSETEINKKALSQYQEENSSVISFVKEACVINNQPRDLNIWVRKQDLSLAYRLYCQINNLHPVSGRAFNKEIREAFPNIQESVKETKTIWRNISLTEEWEEIISKKMEEKPRSEKMN